MSEATFQSDWFSTYENRERHITTQVEILTSVTEQVVFEVGAPAEIFFDPTFDSAVDIGRVSSHTFIFAEIILHAELIIAMGIVSDPGIDDTDRAVSVPRLNLYENLIGEQPFVGRI